MSIKIQYNKQLLEKLCLRDECIVDFTKIEKYNRDITVDFTCKCGNTHNKTFSGINYSGGFCKICTNNNKQQSEYQEKKKEYQEQNKEKIKEKKKEYREQNKEKKKEYREQNKEKKKEKKKEYREQNKETIKEKKKEYREQNKEKIKEYYEQNKEKIKEYREQNKETIKEKKKEYYEQNKEKIKEKKKEYYEQNKEQNKCPHGKCKRYCKECGGSALCKSSWCHTRAIPKYNNYCLTCCINICPEIQVSRNYKTKEKEVVDRIKEKYPDFTWIHDKKVVDGCSKRRPDLLLDMGYHIIIVEVDENKHSGYDCSCENKRLMELSQDLQHRPIVFIRFNPDSYINQNKLKISSCWRTNKLGVIQIMKTRMTEWKERINILNQQIQYWIDNKSNKTIEIIELFYDNYL